MKTLIPSSGRVLGEIVTAFDLRRFDPKKVLSSSTAREYLAGGRGSDATRRSVFRAMAAAIAKAQLLPDGRWRLEVEKPGLPERGRIDVAASLIAIVATGLDQLSGALERLTAPIAYPRHFRDAVLRLVTIDLCVRLTALLWLAGWTSSRPLPTCWFDERGVSLWLRERMADWYPGVSRDGLAGRFRVDPNTVDAWLDREVPPQDENLQAIAGDGDDAARRLRMLRLIYAMRSLYSRLREVHDSDETTAASVRLCELGVAMLTLVERSRKETAENEHKLTMTFAVGTGGLGGPSLPWVRYMVNPVQRAEPDPAWATTMAVVTEPWLGHLQWIAARLGPSLPGEFRRAGVPDDVAEVFLRATQASEQALAELPGFEAVQSTLVDIGGEIGAQVLKERGCAEIARDRLIEASELFRRSVTANPLDPDAHFRLGATLWQIGDVDAALPELEIACQLAPKWDRPVVEIAIVLLNLDRAPDAADRLQRAYDGQVERTDWLLFNLGLALERCERHEDAVGAYKQCLELTPSHGEVLDRLAHLQFVLGDKRLAAQTAKMANHLGFPTVFRAWESGYYKGRGPWSRPPQLLPNDKVHTTDRPWALKPSDGRSAPSK